MLDRFFDPGLELTPLFILADIKKVLAQDDAVIDDYLSLDRGGQDQEAFGLLVADKAHHPLDPSSIIPRAVKQDNLACRGEMRDVALDEDLRLLTFGGSGQCHMPVDPRVSRGR